MIDLQIEDIRMVAELPYDWDKLDNKTIMISGGTGFVGSFIINVLRYRNEHYKQHIKVVSLTRNGGLSDNLVEYISADIRQPIRYAGEIDYIMHLASNTHPKQYAEDPVGTITTNVIGCNNLLDFARTRNVQRFLFASSVEIYGEGQPFPVTEDYCGYINCNHARSGYNEAKRTCETLCQSYKMQYDIDVVIARLARVFGADRKRDTKALSQFMENAVNGTPIVLKSPGLQRYSYCYIADAVSAIIKILLSGASGEAYNVAAEDEGMTLGDYARYIGSLGKMNVTFQIENDQSASKATYALLDTTKISGIGWMPMITTKEGLKRTFLIYKQRQLMG